jgi:hypothetical protein
LQIYTFSEIINASICGSALARAGAKPSMQVEDDLKWAAATLMSAAFDTVCHFIPRLYNVLMAVADCFHSHDLHYDHDFPIGHPEESAT